MFFKGFVIWEVSDKTSTHPLLYQGHGGFQGKQENPLGIKKIQENTSRNHLFSKPVLGLKNASFANRGHQTYAKMSVLGCKFFLELRAAENHLFPEKKDHKIF